MAFRFKEMNQEKKMKVEKLHSRHIFLLLQTIAKLFEILCQTADIRHQKVLRENIIDSTQIFFSMEFREEMDSSMQDLAEQKNEYCPQGSFCFGQPFTYLVNQSKTSLIFFSYLKVKCVRFSSTFYQQGVEQKSMEQ